DLVVARRRQALDQGPAGLDKETDLARVDVTQVLRHHRDAFGRQILQHEARVARPDRVDVEAAQHVAAAEHLGQQVLASRAALEQVVDQQLHRVRAVTRAHALAVLAGQHEVVHSSDLHHRVVQAGGHARSEKGDQRDRVTSRDVVGRKQLDRLGLQGAVVVAGAGGLDDRGDRVHARVPLRGAARYTVRPQGTTMSCAWAKLSEWPANSSPPGASSGAIRASTAYWVGLSK